MPRIVSEPPHGFQRDRRENLARLRRHRVVDPVDVEAADARGPRGRRKYPKVLRASMPDPKQQQALDRLREFAV